jgi:endonuclease YncB( thermonuclease family)
MNYKRFILIAIILLVAVGCGDPVCEYCINRAPDIPIFTTFEPLRSSPSTVAQIVEGMYKVARVIDGDTLIIECGAGTEYRVRLIGIDAPEICPVQPFGIEAKEFVENKIAMADGYARLVFDGDGVDRNRRIRAHVYLAINDNDVWLNNLLVLEGLAVSMLGFRYSDGAKKIFVESEITARREGRNMWSYPVCLISD